MSSPILKSVDERTRLAGANKLEMLLFSLGRDRRTGREEIFGINVFKVREVLRAPEVTRPPEMAPSVEGLLSLRGIYFPVINLVKHANIETDDKPEILIVTEYNGSTQGFLVCGVQTIHRLSWSAMKAPPPNLLGAQGGLITAVTELPDGRVVLMVDVERVLSETSGSLEPVVPDVTTIRTSKKGQIVFFVDDSSVARKQIELTLSAMGLRYESAINGRQAWDQLQAISDRADQSGVPTSDLLGAILTDVEMPEMDGYLLTKQIKNDIRFKGIPVIMHSSLSSTANQHLGRAVGVDAYVPKFEPQKLAEVLAGLFH